MRQAINLVKPGDILIRGYRNYLDGYFIPGFFSHVGLYLGEVPKQGHDALVPDVLEKFYKKGTQIVMHSMAQGVFMEDVLNFCRCDYMVILRRNEAIEPPEIKAVTFDKIYQTAMKSLGKPYDFKFDFSQFHTLSCTEFVYASDLELMKFYDVKIKPRRVLGIKKDMLIPDDFIMPKFQVVWKSRSVKDKKWKKILKKNSSA